VFVMYLTVARHKAPGFFFSGPNLFSPLDFALYTRLCASSDAETWASFPILKKNITHWVELRIHFTILKGNSGMLRSMYHSVTNCVRQYVKARHHKTVPT
jgi:hypothetical protein